MKKLRRHADKMAEIREWRERLGLTQEDMANMLGMKRRQYLTWENEGTSTVKVNKAKRFLRMYEDGIEPM